mgnify:CR=1 FL=1
MLTRGVWLTIAATVFGTAWLPAAVADQRPNVLWIYLEDVSGWFSCYGEKLVETPNIDRLAARGTRFTRFYTSAGVCSRSAASAPRPSGRCRRRMESITIAVLGTTPRARSTTGSA